MADAQFLTGQQTSTLATNKVLKNTYMLLSMTLIWSAMMAGLAMVMDVPYMGIMPMLVAFGLIFAISKMRNSSWAILLVFAFTGILGFSIGPTISSLVGAGKGDVVTMALGMTGFIFFALSAYVLTTKKDFSFMGGFLMTGLMVVIGFVVLSFVASFFFNYQISGLSLAISGAVVLLMSGFILYDTSNIINGGETNYIMATVSLYLNIYNIFVSLLHILGVTSDD